MFFIFVIFSGSRRIVPWLSLLCSVVLVIYLSSSVYWSSCFPWGIRMFHLWMRGDSQGGALTRSTSDGSADMDESVSGAHPEYTKVHRDCRHG